MRRAERVRDIGVRSAMAMEVFLRALTLVSGLAQALIYGLGGYLALQGELDAGTVVTMALLLTRLYAPLTALATARLDVVTALVSFERVFEVLDIAPAHRGEARRPHPARRAGGGGARRDVRFAYPSADQVSLASLEEVATLDDRAGEEVLHGVSARVEPGQMVALVGSSGAGQVDAGLAGAPPLRRGRGCRAPRRASTCATSPSTPSGPPVGVVTQDGHLFHDTIAANLRYARPDGHRRRAVGRAAQARLADLVASLPDGPRHAWWASAATASPAASASA